MSSRIGNPHILVIPYPAQGHMIPLMELSKYLAKHGFRITFISTQQNNELIMKSFTSQDNKIGVVSIDSSEKGYNSSGEIMRVMPGKVEQVIEEINASNSDKISCIIADQSIGWALELAERKGIPRAAFCPAAAAQLLLGFSIPKLIQDGIIDQNGTPKKDQIVKLSPTMPAMKASNLVWACLGNIEAQKNIFQLMLRNNKSIKLTDWLLCNSAYDLEPAAFNLSPHHILPIGPISSINTQTTNPSEDQDLSCLKWLDQQPPKSVIYVAFGSSTVLDPNQFQELALGLELSNKPFLWVVRSDITTGSTSFNAFLEEFKKRVENVGKIVGWVPQKKVLDHPCVACFISHCGWNSIIEGVSNGVPFLCWPYFADQFMNGSYICDVWRNGLGFDRDENGVIVRGEIKNKVEMLLSDGDVKNRALYFKEIVRNCVKEGGSSCQNLEKFVNWLTSLV
ncbi:UDP-glycosyltransferase 83A1-like [Euphorbia lathyris]|uniref:UDP-glycosyltransferase 83A1-like n=1 Tax=Euphorbia lathyris TaxID=212925 RepID=UPI00331419A3